ncbi:hypothetical protein [Variovorax rhizosphaerae]|uniref:Uncharacterized protein n=1 Tax=Variovorax rhizosphaerae TaxID=1836200 RepID=A0ABU8WGW3_9BURK
MSHVLASTSNGILVGGILTFTIALIATFGATATPFLAVAGAMCLSVVFNMWAWRRAEMFPIPEESAEAARTVGWFLTGLYALLALFT